MKLYELKVEDEEIDEMIAKLKKGIKKKRETEEKKDPKHEELPLPETVTLLLPLVIAAPAVAMMPVSKAPLPTKYCPAILPVALINPAVRRLPL